MQNSKKGQERYCKWLRGKGKTTNDCKVPYDAQARTGTKRCSAKTG